MEWPPQFPLKLSFLTKGRQELASLLTFQLLPQKSFSPHQQQDEYSSQPLMWKFPFEVILEP